MSASHVASGKTFPSPWYSEEGWMRGALGFLPALLEKCGAIPTPDCSGLTSSSFLSSASPCENGAYVLLGAQVSAPEEPVSPRLAFIIIRDYSGDSVVMHTSRWCCHGNTSHSDIFECARSEGGGGESGPFRVLSSHIKGPGCSSRLSETWHPKNPAFLVSPFQTLPYFMKTKFVKNHTFGVA